MGLSGEKSGAPEAKSARLCARICARSNRFLLAIRELDDFLETSRFPLVKRVTNCTEKHGSEIDGFAILSLARLPISPPWQRHLRLVSLGLGFDSSKPSEGLDVEKWTARQ